MHLQAQQRLQEEGCVVDIIHLTTELVHRNEFHILVHAKLVMCLLVSSFRMLTEHWGRVPY